MSRLALLRVSFPNGSEKTFREMKQKWMYQKVNLPSCFLPIMLQTTPSQMGLLFGIEHVPASPLSLEY